MAIDTWKDRTLVLIHNITEIQFLVDWGKTIYNM